MCIRDRPHEVFTIGDCTIQPIEVMHGRLPILGYRIGKLAYITDMKTINPSELPYLEGIETLVVSALRWEKEHHSHQLIKDAIAFSQQIHAKQTYLTHLTHQIGLHDDASNLLPENVHLAYDGLEIEV